MPEKARDDAEFPVKLGRIYSHLPHLTNRQEGQPKSGW
jgi:hypothetical protein